MLAEEAPSSWSDGGGGCGGQALAGTHHQAARRPRRIRFHTPTGQDSDRQATSTPPPLGPATTAAASTEEGAVVGLGGSRHSSSQQKKSRGDVAAVHGAGEVSLHDGWEPVARC